MAFNYHGYGAYLECECDGQNIIVYRNSGEIRKYPTTLKTVLPKQRIPFDSRNILWYMENAEHTMYFVGRADGSINGYDIGTNLMRRISNWKPPEDVICQDVGSCFDECSKRMVIDCSDMRTCYILDSNDEYVFNEPFHSVVNIPAAIALCVRHERGIHIIKASGEEVDVANAGRWIVSNSTSWSDKKKLL